MMINIPRLKQTKKLFSFLVFSNVVFFVVVFISFVPFH